MADNALYALTLDAFTISPLKASREPEVALENEESVFAHAQTRPPFVFELL